MTLEGAIKLSEATDFIIYTMNSVVTGQYSVVVPNNVNGTLNMLVDLHMKSFFDEVMNGVKTKEQLISNINSLYNKLKVNYTNGVLVMPMVDETMLQNAVLAGDKQKMFDEVKKIGAITSELYKKLTDSGLEKQSIDQKITIVEKNDIDSKFVVWLKEQMPNFVDGFKLEQANIQPAVNPFVDNNNLFGSAPVETKVENVIPNINGGGIFDNVSSSNVTSSSVSPVDVNNSNELFTTPVTEPVVNNNVNTFETPTSVQGANNGTSENIANVPAVENQAVSSSVTMESPNVEQTSIAEAPKPVESTSLDSTITLNPVGDVEKNENTENVATDSNNSNRGFANLAILLVVLVGVTLVSIELGKYLYNTFGA